MSGGRSLLGRRRGNLWFRSGIIVIIFIFLWLQINFLSLGDSSDSNSDYNDSTAAILSMVPAVLHKFLTPRPRNSSNAQVNGSLNLNMAYRDTLSISDIKRNIAQYNLQQTVYNEDIFGPLQNDSVVIVIQIHDRITYLRHLIVSLAQAHEISQALIVFSHDYYDEEINALVQSVDFCKVMQIFYPYSIQTHPHEFPGEDPNDCPRDIKRDQALVKKCNNARYPDLYGHYREAKFTQTKHHWWWKANRVFNQLEITRNHTGLVVFLEEDHYVAEDFIHVLKLMDRTCRVACKHCNIISLGTYLKTYNYYGDSKKVEITPWISSKHNMGMAFNKSTWMEIASCADYFCKYDDYNWDWSLQHISQNCLKNKLHAMVVRGPRVFHIGECGVHHKKNNCESTSVISKVQRVLKTAKRHLYPDHLTLTYITPLKKTKLRKGNGGWGDHRDHMLCMGRLLICKIRSGGCSLFGWRRANIWVRTSIILIVFTFLYVQINLFVLRSSSDSNSGYNNSIVAILRMVPAVLNKGLVPRPLNSSNSQNKGSLNPNIGWRDTLSISDIKLNIAQYNLQQTIYNEDMFGPLRNDSVVIVIQIHDRITYLRHLIASLAQAREISKALIVFSHDYYDEEINALVQSVDFCKVMQIFYPYSLQTHPHEFPGQDPNDCPRNITKEQALVKKCNNARYPDLYGHYREAKFTQIKHHWWWKANRIFNQLNITRNHTGLVVFLEEDHYVAEDFIHVLKLMDRTCRFTCKHCNIISLGTYLKTYNYYGDSKKVEITPWISSKHNMGMAFNKSTWMEIINCADNFCKYDDYNWDWSLQHVSQNCLKNKLHAMVVKAPRVFHLGECGVHHKKNNCESTSVLSKVQRVLKTAKIHLYPDHLTLMYVILSEKTKLSEGNGGWADHRDHMLCMGMTLK